MVHYIRFLRTPQIHVTKKSTDINAVIAVTTDLGDSLLAQDAELTVELVEAHHPHRVLKTSKVQWRDGSRACKFTIACSNKEAKKTVIVHVTGPSTKSGVVSKILDWLNGRLCSPTKAVDASLGFLIYFDQNLKASGPDDGALARLIQLSRAKRLKVLELGAGCGIVGITFAHLVKSDVILTDLEDAQEIMDKNIRCASPLAGSSLQTQKLDWAARLDDSLSGQFDLVLVSDCIYNPDSSVHLVETLRQLATRAPKVLVLVGFKRRHDADSVFFDRMNETQFQVVDSVQISLPHTLTDHDTEAPTIEFYSYRVA
ncbi:hypothetical protein PV10_02126 [Exophiala mesophila]|uniref:Uncharacterized protein n=1 Tax=Exophiala mesophila TaxID=212818 RepID=A0A0D1ZIB7_EXOME|nr:uncharacterized protein PV10_02126 [Exophiala mesophila]KIV94352.1 hypothetical protein PV10_02126 [Exophiala mesophila]